MIHFADWLGHWSVDVYLLGSVLLILALLATATLRQPVHRLAITKSLFIALALLAVLCAVPGWSVLHLLTAKPPAPSESAQPVLPPISPANLSGDMRVTNRPPTMPILAPPPAPAQTLPRTNLSAWTFAGAIELLGAVAVLVWLAAGWLAAHSLRRHSHEAPRGIQELLQQIATASPYKHAATSQIFISNRLNVPVALGLARPTIVLPDSMVDSSSTLAPILAHELAHIQNRDLHWLALSRLLLIIFWPQPLYWFARRRMRLDQESLADAAAADLTTREKYAEQLVAWARNLTNTYPARLASAVGLWEGPSQLRQRIAILLDARLTLLRDCSRHLRFASAALCGTVAIVLSLVTLRPGQSAQPADAQEAKLTEPEAAQVESAIKVLRETDGKDQFEHADGWTTQIRVLAEIGKPAAPALIKALDNETKDDAISKLAFALRAVGDPRAVPALIRAIPRTLLPGCSDFALRVSDPALLKFLQENDDALGKHHGDTFSYGRAFREVSAALQKLTSVDQGDMELNSISLGRTETQQRIERKLFHDLAERWATWWSNNWQRFDVGEAYAAVNLPPLKEQPITGDAPPHEFPVGKQLKWANGSGGIVLDSVTETKQRCFYDLDTGRTAGWPKEIPPLDNSNSDLKPILKWAAEQGFDIMGITYQPPGSDAPLYCLQPINMKFWQITRDEQKDLPKAFQGDIPLPLSHPVERLIPNNESAEPYFGTDLGGTAFLFITREGTAGRLRITAQVTDTNIQPGKVLMPDDQYSPVGSIRGAKIGLQFIQEVTEDKQPKAVGNSATEKPNANAAQPAATNDKPSNSKTETQNQPNPNTVAGLALKENHDPVAAAEAFLFRYDFIDSSRKLIGETKTDSDGRFQFDNVIDIEKEFPGKKFPARDLVGGEFIQCIVRAPDLVPFEWMATTAQVAEQGMFRAAVMPTGATLTGRITDPNGAPVAGALVTVGRGFGNWEGINSARTDANGNYHIANLQPFDLAAYKKQQQEAQHSGGSVFMASPESLTIEAPGFAIKQTSFAKIPGEQDVQLVRPAVLKGRAIYGDSHQPAPNILVQASTMITAENVRRFQSGEEFLAKAAARTDQAGTYRFSTLPPGSYSIFADTPDWVTTGVTVTDATSAETKQLSDLIFTKGGVVSVRLVDSKTNQPFPLEPDMHILLSASSTSSPPVGGQTVKSNLRANILGRFEMHAPAGKKSVAVGGVTKHDGVTTWYGRQQVEVDVVDSQSVEIDVPVERFEGATGTLSTAVWKLNEEGKKDEKAESSSSGKPSSESQQKSDVPKSSKLNEGTAPKPKASESPHLSLVIAKHALLLGGNELTTWEELTAKIAALPNPSKAQLHFYSTNGALEIRNQQALHDKIYELSQKFKLQGHSEGTLLPRTGARYDHIEKQSDLAPDPSLRVTGTVFDTKNQPVAGAEVVLIAPVDESLPYKDFDITMVEGRIRNPLDEIITVSDEAGHFAVYPPKGAKYRLLVNHPNFGFNLTDDDSLASTAKVTLLPWAKLTCVLGAEEGEKQSASLNTRPQTRAGYPNVTIEQNWEDLKLKARANTFTYAHVPVILQTDISRTFAQSDGSVSISAASVSLLPDEDRQIDLGPMSGKQREWLQWNREQFNKRNASPQTDGTAPRPTLDSKPGTHENSSDDKKTSEDSNDDSKPEDIKRKLTAPLLATMAKDNGYELKRDQDLRRVAPPFAPIRLQYYGVENPLQADITPAGPDAMTFLWKDGKLQYREMFFTGSKGYTLPELANAIFGLPSQQIEGPKDLLDNALPGDWVVRKDADESALTTQLQHILQTELAQPIKLRIATVERSVYIARGSFTGSPVPVSWAKRYEPRPRSEPISPDFLPGEGPYRLNLFLNWVGDWIRTPIVSEVKDAPMNVAWRLDELRENIKHEDAHNAERVLADLTTQTGIEFTPEKRKIKMMFVERATP